MKPSPCSVVKRVVLGLFSEPQLKNRIYAAGGIVPWLLSGTESGRNHGDIDMVVAQKDMAAIRDYLKRSGLYREDWDSLRFAFNAERMDCGVEAIIDGVPVNFAPFEVKGNTIIQRNFSLEALAGYDALLIATIEDLSLDDYITRFALANGEQLGAYTLEVIKASKENSDREKDAFDIREIERLGIDHARYERVKAPIQNIRINFIAQDTEG